MLTRHEPYPAVVLDRGWNVLRANKGAARLFGGLLAPDPIPEQANVLRLMIEPGPVRDAVLDLTTAELVRELRARPEVAAVLSGGEPADSTPPVLCVRFRWQGTEFGFFSVVSTIGTPIDVTAQKVRVEAFFPSDDHPHRMGLKSPGGEQERPRRNRSARPATSVRRSASRASAPASRHPSIRRRQPKPALNHQAFGTSPLVA